MASMVYPEVLLATGLTNKETTLATFILKDILHCKGIEMILEYGTKVHDEM